MSSLPQSELTPVYQEILLRRYRNRANRRELDAAGLLSNKQTRKCGDWVRLSLLLAGEPSGQRIEDCVFAGDGCSISQAGADLACDFLRGQGIIEARSGLDQILAFLDQLEAGQTIAAPIDLLADLVAFEGLARFPTRVACARLAFTAGRTLLGPA